LDNLQKAPTDPSNADAYYVMSISSTGKFFNVAATLEGTDSPVAAVRGNFPKGSSAYDVALDTLVFKSSASNLSTGTYTVANDTIADAAAVTANNVTDGGSLLPYAVVSAN
jgi:hypothetical protein